MNKITGQRKLKSLLMVTLTSCGTFSAICLYKGDEKFYRNFVMPAIHLVNPERAHKLAILASQYRLVPKTTYKDPDTLKVKLFGKEFPNPIGIAAGFDKDGKAIMGLKDIGFGFVEIGSVTPLPQPGNDLPRVFRLKEDGAIINRYGFNSEGHNEVLKRVHNVRKSEEESAIIGVNLGKNKTSENYIQDYVDGINKFGPVADYLVINISSPNTPGLRNLQNKESLSGLLNAVVKARNNLPLKEKPPLLLKLAPDLTYEERKDIAKIIQDKNCRVDGLIISNTTIDRPQSLKSSDKNESGGLSGKPLSDASTQMIADMRKLTNGIPIIGVGGISSGQNAYDKIKAGASLIQVYSALVYEGPPLVARIKKELVELLNKDGFSSISEAVGTAAK